MCGIAALLLYPQERSAEEWQIIKQVLTDDLLFNEDRGRSATGVAIIQADGRVNLLKMAMSATKFVATPEYQSLLEEIGSQTTVILGHTRKPTKGSPTRNDNNHPLQAGSTWGVHNGTINNDDSLFEIHGYPRRAEVDSEIIFRLLEPFDPTLPDYDYLNAIRPELQSLQGQFTFLACDQRAPEKLLVVKHDNPLSLHFHAPLRILIFSSRYIFLRKMFGPVLLTETLAPDQLLRFDAYKLPSLAHHPQVALSLEDL